MTKPREAHGVRNAMLLFGSIIIASVIAIGLLIVSAVDSSKEREATESQVEAQIHAAKLNAYIACLRGVDGRNRIRQMFEDELTIFIAAQTEEPTPAQEEATKRVVALVEKRASEVLPNVNCIQTTPPPRMTPAERKQTELPPEPIPPLTIPE